MYKDLLWHAVQYDQWSSRHNNTFTYLHGMSEKRLPVEHGLSLDTANWVQDAADDLTKRNAYLRHGRAAPKFECMAEC